MKVAVSLTIAFFIFVSPLYAQTIPPLFKEDASTGYTKTLAVSTPSSFTFAGLDRFLRWFNANKKPQKREQITDKQKLREEWQEFLGIDVFAPYFKAKEVEKYVQEKTKVEFFNFRGRAEFEEGSSSVKYIFKKRF